MAYLKAFKLAIWVTIALGAWAFASPVGSDPDGDFHLVSIYCGGGFKQGVCEQATDDQGKKLDGVVKVRSSLLVKNGEIQVEFRDQEFVYTDRHNVSGTYETYPKGFYWIQSKFTRVDVIQTALLLRSVNVLLFVLLFVLASSTLPYGLQKNFSLASLVTLLPLGMFIISSNNPSSWAITGGVTYWAFLYAYFEARSRKWTVWFGALSFFSALVGSLSRGDFAVWTIVVAIAVALIVRSRNLVNSRELLKKSKWVTAILAPALIVAVTSQQTRAVLNGFTDPKGIWGRDPSINPKFDISDFLYNLTKLPGIFAGVFGLQGTGGGLGFSDVFMPEVVSLGMISLLVYLIANASGKRSRLECVTLISLLLVICAASLAVVIRSNQWLPWGIQSRYLIPVLVPLVGIYFSGSTLLPKIEKSRFVSVMIAITLIVAYVCALHATMMRYVHRSDNFLENLNWNLNSDQSWWWDRFVQPMFVLLVGSMSFSRLVFFILFDHKVGKLGTLVNRLRRRLRLRVSSYRSKPRLT